MPLSPRLDRRALLSGAVAALAASAVSVHAAAGELDPSNPKELARIFRKLAFAADERIGFWWLRGTRGALVDTDVTPLWDMHIGSIFRARDLPDGQFEVSTIQTAFYTDLKSGERLRTFANPFTRKTIDIPRYPAKVERLTYDAHGRTDPPSGFLAGLDRDAKIGPAWVQGDDVWIKGDVVIKGAPKAPGERPIRVNDLTTYFGSVRDVLDPSVAMPLAGQTFIDINIWPPWLEMGNQKGDYFSRCYGRKAASFDAMPTLWRQWMKEDFPKVTADFDAALGV